MLMNLPRDNKSSCEREVTLAPGQPLPRDSSLSRVHVNRPLGPVHMIPGQLIAPGQLTDPGVIFASVHGLTSVTVHMSFSLPRGNFERRVTRCTTSGNPPFEVTFLHVNRTQKLPRGKSSLAHAHY